MNTIAIISAIIAIILIGLFILKFQSKKNIKNSILDNEIKTPKISYIPIKKNQIGKINYKDDFSFDISTITQKDNQLDLLISFHNNSTKHVRIDIKKTVLNLNGHEIIGDHQLKEMTMGTNDIILKNTILSGGNLIRNIYFSNISTEDFFGKVFLKIDLLINGESHNLENSFENSTVNEVKVIQE